MQNEKGNVVLGIELDGLVCSECLYPADHWDYISNSNN